MSKVLCIYHGGCADGFGAAWVVRRAFADYVEFVAASYNQPPPDVTGRNVLIVDFSYKRAVLEQMIETARSILVIDHHRSAAQDLVAWLGAPPTWEAWRTIEGTEHPALRISALFDMDRSGAGLTWDYFNPGQPRPPLIDHIEDRDLWRFRLPHTRPVHAVLMSYPYDFGVWDDIAMRVEAQDPVLIAEGVAIDRRLLKETHEVIGAGKRRMTIAGHDVPACNAPYLMASDAGNIMGEGEPFAATYFDGPDGRAFSLRSRGAGLDVSEIAKLFGGGGHRNAAGFLVPHGADVSKAGLGADPVPTQSPSF